MGRKSGSKKGGSQKLEGTCLLSTPNMTSIRPVCTVVCTIMVVISPTTLNIFQLSHEMLRIIDN